MTQDFGQAVGQTDLEASLPITANEVGTRVANADISAMIDAGGVISARPIIAAIQTRIVVRGRDIEAAIVR